MPALLVVAKPVSGEHEIPRIVKAPLGGPLAVLQSGQREKWLEGRTGRIRPRQRPVDEGLVGRIVKRIPVLAVDPLDEQVRIEARLRDERQDVAAVRLDRDERTASVTERLFGDLLELHVQGQDEIVARNRRCARERAHRVPTGRSLDLLVAGRAMQVFLVALLEPFLADVIGALIVAKEIDPLAILTIRQRVDVALALAPDVADDVRGHFV